ncbi:MAG: glycosyltransferase family 4 protein [Chloroflexi bacterium]|nr:glycosyltransferase family 4 protein [Chloroflexota bacterium]
MVISTALPPQEGLSFYVWNLSRFLVEQGHHVQIITRGEHGKPFYEALEGIPVWRPRFLPVYPLHVYLHGLFVQRLVKRLEPEVDIFHLHTPLPPPIRSTRPIMVTVHSLMLPDARSRRIEGVYDFLTKAQAPVCALIEKRLASISQQATAVSPPVAEAVQRLLPQKQGRVEVMWNGVDTRFFLPDSRIQANPGELLYVGRLAPGKGLHDLVQAFAITAALFPDIRLSIAGSGPLYDTLVSMIDESGLATRIRLVGHMSSREALRALYQQAWGLILPSHHEGLPGVMLEAMACGTPVIATRVGGIPGVITDGVNGLLVAPRAPDQLAGAISRLRKDAALRSRLGQAARRTIEEQFSWQVIGQHYVKCYAEMLAGASR